MRIAILQPYLFPYIGYFQLVKAVDKFILFDDVNYINKGWINRNVLCINGRPGFFTVPLENASQNRLIKDINIFSSGKWKRNILKTIEFSYRKAPYFEQAFPLLTNIICEDTSSISSFIYNSLQEIESYLGIDTELVASSEKYGGNELNYEDRIIHICIQEKATHYINPIGGLSLYKKETFAQKDIELKFLRPGLITYKQHSPVFIPGLSLIDVIMFNSIEHVGHLLNAYALE